MRRPASSSSAWRVTSKTSALWTARKLFMFLTSTFDPSSVEPTGRSETLASQRKLPSSMFALLTPMYRMIRCSFTR